MHKIADATWKCGDPGMQYDTTINKWHTSKNTARINASNPCSEYMFLDDSACNLASFNLLKFLTPGGQFDIASYRYAIAIVTTAMEIIVDAAGYPTEMIARNSHDYRPLGLGYANLGALLMAFGLPYDSDAGRDFAATLTAILCGDAYWQSARIAETCSPLGAATPITQQSEISGGACPGFYVNREPFLDVIRMHRAEVNNIGQPKKKPVILSEAQSERSESKGEVEGPAFVVPQLDQLIAASRHAWDGALAHGEKHGFRNSQVTVLAPTGTIGFMMDCDTTGIEPELALVKYKKLVGGGMIKIVNSTVPSALIKLGYNEAQVNAIVSYIDATGTTEGAPGIKPEHLAVFDCSFKPAKGTRSIHYMGHIKMMAATQPFLSGAISKTVNLPQDCSVDDIAEAYMQAWRLGIKAIAIYRDNSKGTQPLNVQAQTDDKKGTRAVPSSGELAEAEQNLASAADRIASLEAANAALNRELTQLLAASTQNVDAADAQAPPRASRHRLPGERASVTHKFAIAGHEGYITVGLYPNGYPGEIFIRMAKEGSTVSGLMDSFATAISISLQHGVPLRVLCEKFAHTRFEPSGWTGNPEIGYAKSIMDYIFRWIQVRFLSGHQLDLFASMNPAANGDSSSEAPASDEVPTLGNIDSIDASASADWLSSRSAVGVPGEFARGGEGAGVPGELARRGGGAEGSASSTSSSSDPRISPESPHYSGPNHQALSDEDIFDNGAGSHYSAHSQFDDRTPPRHGIAPEPSAPLPTNHYQLPTALEDRGLYGVPGAPGAGMLYHPADAMRAMVDMGDAPSCATCGSIMTRSGSCYRCMSCGSTSGCS